MLARGYEPIVFDDLSNGHRAAPPAAAKLIVGDVADRRLSIVFFPNTGHRRSCILPRSIEAGESMRHPKNFPQQHGKCFDAA